MDPPGEHREPPPQAREDALRARHRSDMALLRGGDAAGVKMDQFVRSQSAHQWGRSNSATFGYAKESDVPPVSVVDLSALSQQSSYQLTNITNHYRRNQKLLTAFEQQVVEPQPQGMAVAYLIGLIFVEVALFRIPTHGYYYSKRHKEERLQSSVDALRVTHQLEEILMQQQQEFHASTSLIGDAANDRDTKKRKEELIRESVKLERLRHFASEQFESASHGRRNDEPPRSIKTHISEYVKSLVNSCIAPSSTSPSSHRDRSDSTVAHADTPSRGRGMSLTESLMVFGSSFSDGICPTGTKEGPKDEPKRDSIRYAPTPPTPLTPTPTPTPTPPSISASASASVSTNRHTSIATAIPLSPSIETTLDTDQYVNVSVSDDNLKSVDPRESFSEYQYLHQSAFDSGSDFLLAASIDTSKDRERLERLPLEHQYSESDIRPVESNASSNVSATANGVSIELLSQCYHDDFDAMCEGKRITVRQTKTFQGKMPDSTNGCTIIAPLMCIHHFHDDNKIPDEGITLETIEEVIDNETPSILPSIRDKLGVARNGFLIPSDAHESLMEQQYLATEQFVTVCGGNILDDTHLDALIKAMREAKPKKLAATLFFHEHVISILQLRREAPVIPAKGKNGADDAEDDKSESKKHYPRVWFDIVDSLPHKKTIARFLTNDNKSSTRTASTIQSSASASSAKKPESPQTPKRKKKNRKPIAAFMGRMKSTKSPKSSSAAQLLNSYDDDDVVPAELIPEQRPTEPFLNSYESRGSDCESDDDLPQPNAIRMRCLDEASLVAALRWYACSAFTDSNCAYINKYPWDENNADADPRIFQAFVWSEA